MRGRQTPQSVTVPGRQRPPRGTPAPSREEGTPSPRRPPSHSTWRPSPQPRPPRDSHGPQVNPSEKKKDKKGKNIQTGWRDAGRASCRVPSLGLAIGSSCVFQEEGFCLQFSEGTRPSCFIVSYILKFSSEMYTPLFSGVAAKCSVSDALSLLYIP